MRKLFTILCAVCFLWTSVTILISCSKDPELDLPEPVTNEEIMTRVINKERIYDPETELWYETGWDPYEINHANIACSEIASGKSPFSPKDPYALEGSPNARPTHYVLRVKPRSLEEVDELYETIGNEISSIRPDWKVSVDQSGSTTGYERETVYGERYYYTEELDEDEDEEGEESQSIMLPIFYTLWPLNTEMPDLVFDYMYGIWLPDYNSPWDELIEKESIRSLYGDIIQGNTQTNPSAMIVVSDPVTQKYLPITYVVVEYTVGSKRYETTTDANGRFEFAVGHLSGIGTPRIIWRYSDKFKLIASGGKQHYTDLALKRVPNDLILLDPGHVSYVLANVYRGAITFVKQNHGLDSSLPCKHFKIYVKQSDERSNFIYKRSGDTYVNLRTENFNTPQGIGNSLFLTTLHELGHATMYVKKGKYHAMKNTDKIIIESWAEFVAWHISNFEYSRINYQLDNPLFTRIIDYNHVPDHYFGFCNMCIDRIPHLHSTTPYTVRYNQFNDHQLDGFLNRGKEYKYTGLFIDLRDDFNQALNAWMNDSDGNNFNDFPNDRISNLPLEYIENIANYTKYYADIKRELYNDISLYDYTRRDLDDLFKYYDRIYAEKDNHQNQIRMAINTPREFAIDFTPFIEHTFNFYASDHITLTTLNPDWNITITPSPGLPNDYQIVRKTSNSITLKFTSKGTYNLTGDFVHNNTAFSISRPIIIKEPEPDPNTLPIIKSTHTGNYALNKWYEFTIDYKNSPYASWNKAVINSLNMQELDDDVIVEWMSNSKFRLKFQRPRLSFTLAVRFTNSNKTILSETIPIPASTNIVSIGYTGNPSLGEVTFDVLNKNIFFGDDRVGYIAWSHSEAVSGNQSISVMRSTLTGTSHKINVRQGEKYTVTATLFNQNNYLITSAQYTLDLSTGVITVVPPSDSYFLPGITYQFTTDIPGYDFMRHYVEWSSVGSGNPSIMVNGQNGRSAQITFPSFGTYKVKATLQTTSGSIISSHTLEVKVAKPNIFPWD